VTVATAATREPIRATRALLATDRLAKSVEIEIHGARIGAVREDAAAARSAPYLALPPLANAHDHLRAIRSVALGGWNLPFELWTLTQASAPKIDPYIAALVALGRSALGGCGSVMVHYTRPQGGRPIESEAARIARAAELVGVRIAFAVALRDRNPLVYGDEAEILAGLPAELGEVLRSRARSPDVAEQIAAVRRVAETCASQTFDVQYGPVGPQWCSDKLLAAVAEASALDGRRVHMHLLETKAQKEWADAAYPGGVIRHLDALGLLSERLCVAHAVWAAPEELDLLALRRVRIATNPSSNLVLGSGIAPIAAAIARKVDVAMGLDGLSLDEDDDALRELRLLLLLHKGVGFERGLDQATALHCAAGVGRATLSALPASATLEAGGPADVLLLDRSGLAPDPLSAAVGDLDLLFARARKEHIHSMIVAGRDVVIDGRLVGFDFAAAERELYVQARAGTKDHDDWQRRADMLPGLIGRFYASRHHCCG
jgi:cytosine/adenosine deaminase-related metal-dependent hydrolase